MSVVLPEKTDPKKLVASDVLRPSTFGLGIIERQDRNPRLPMPLTDDPGFGQHWFAEVKYMHRWCYFGATGFLVGAERRELEPELETKINGYE